jgi:hypothetical protein
MTDNKKCRQCEILKRHRAPLLLPQEQCTATASRIERFTSNKTAVIIYRSLQKSVRTGCMGRAWSTNGGEEECIEGIGREARRKETTRKTKR